MTSFPARLHGLLAAQAPVGVIIRRGPAKRVCTLLWNRKTDELTLGQWLHGRIYERRCDLSPDGQYFIYFAMNGRWSSEVKGSWTAISRAPWLKAIALYSKGDCWLGGGLFTGDRTYWLNGGCTHAPVRESREVRQDTTYQPQGYYGGECSSVYYRRLQRDGWAYLQIDAPYHWSDLHIFEKPLNGGWLLRKYAHADVGPPPGKGCYWDEHELEHVPSGTILQYPDWEWAEWDRTRLVWAEKGCLYAGHLRSHRQQHELENVKLIYNFNTLLFEARTAPY